MSEVFIKILNMSISASWLILAVILLRPLLKKAPKWINCLLWGIVAIRLILPFSFEAKFSLVPSTQTIPENMTTEPIPEIDSGISTVDKIINPILSENFAYSQICKVNLTQIIFFVASLIWIFGAAVILSYGIAEYIKLKRRVAASLPLHGNVYICDDISSPFVLGIIKPRIYLPSAMPEEYAEYVLAHEKAHLKRKDNFFRIFAYILLAVYWFNPLVWAAYILFCRDTEKACDESVIKYMEKADTKAYAEALLACSMHRAKILTCPLAFGEVGVKDRIKSIFNYKKPAFLLVAVAILLCIATVVCFLTNPYGGVKRKYVTNYEELLLDGNEHSFALSEFSDTEFIYDANALYVKKNGKTEEIFGADEIKNLFIADVTGDGISDICATMRKGTHLCNTYINVLDYHKNDIYSLKGDGFHNFNYSFITITGEFNVEKREALPWGEAERGILVYNKSRGIYFKALDTLQEIKLNGALNHLIYSAVEEYGSQIYKSVERYEISVFKQEKYGNNLIFHVYFDTYGVVYKEHPGYVALIPKDGALIITIEENNGIYKLKNIESI